MIDWQVWLNKLKVQLTRWSNKVSAANNDAGNSTPGQLNLFNKKIQKQHLMILVIAASVVLLVIFFYNSNGKQPVAKKKPSNNDSSEVSFSSPVDKVDEQSIWLERAESKLSNEQKNTSTLEKMVGEQAASTKTQSLLMSQQQATIESLSGQVSSLEQQLTELASRPSNASQIQEQNSNSVNNPKPLITGMAITTLSLTPEPVPADGVPEKTPDNYVPSGSYVKAIMLGGLDASASVNSQTNPRPVLLRTIDMGTLPNNYHSHLKNCRIIGAGYGDLSSERAYIRLESMSCMRDGVLVDFPVYGYVSGSDGKDGVRGTVVMRDGDLVTKAFVGGALSGFGDSVSDNYTTTSISPLGSTTSVNNGQSLEYGAAQGISNAADLYAQYNIKRAEQLQPVIEVSAGTVVDIVFNKGFYLDGLSDKDHTQATQTSANTAALSNQFAVSSTNADTISGNMDGNNLSSQVQQITNQPLPMPNDVQNNNQPENVSATTQPLQEFP
ncbi:MAG: TraB/VirB10 family protein [Gammaproteobacteria bacterium]